MLLATFVDKIWQPCVAAASERRNSWLSIPESHWRTQVSNSIWRNCLKHVLDKSVSIHVMKRFLTLLLLYQDVGINIRRWWRNFSFRKFTSNQILYFWWQSIH